jgi:protein TonB
MLRIRQAIPVAGREAAARLALALALSVALHLLLLGRIGLQPGAEAGKAGVVLHARLAPPAQAGPVVPVIDRPLAHPAAARETTPPAPVDTEPAAMPEAVAQLEEAADAPLSLPDPVHYPAAELDLYPRLLDPVRPAWSEPAREAHLAGSVTLLVLVDENGHVTEATVVDADPAGVFDEVARAAFLHAAFAPAQKDGRRVRSRILVSVGFDPDKP